MRTWCLTQLQLRLFAIDIGLLLSLKTRQQRASVFNCTMQHTSVVVVADDEDRFRFVLGPAGCGKTLAAKALLDALQLLQGQTPKLVGWHFIRLDVQYTHTLPQFLKLLCQVLSPQLATWHGTIVVLQAHCTVYGTL